jgi:hypothetical protein
MSASVVWKAYYLRGWVGLLIGDQHFERRISGPVIHENNVDRKKSLFGKGVKTSLQVLFALIDRNDDGYSVRMMVKLGIGHHRSLRKLEKK